MRFVILFILSLSVSFQAFGATTRTIDADFLRSSDRTKTWTPPASTDTLTGNSTSANLLNKTLTAPIIDDAVKLVEEASTPTTPAAGYKLLYPKTDGKMYTLNSAGVETQVGAGAGGGGINWLTETDNETTSTWNAFADAASSTGPVDGTGGTATVTCARTADTNIKGSYVMRITKPASNVQGQGCSTDFTIDKGYRTGRALITFPYRINSGTFADTDVQIWIYDKDNARLMQPDKYKLTCSSSTSCWYAAEFQLDASADDYRLIAYIASTSTSAWTADIDEQKVAPYTTGVAPPYVSEWVTSTCTNSWATWASVTCKYRRIGDSAEIQWLTTISTAPSGGLSFSLPTGLSIDTTKIVTTSATSLAVGRASVYDVSGATDFPFELYYSSATVVVPRSLYVTSTSANVAGATGITPTFPMTFANTDTVTATARVPILGWGVAGTSPTETSDGRPVFFKGAAVGQTVSGSATTILDTSVVYDTHSQFSTSTDSYTIRESGYYTVRAKINGATQAQGLLLYKNGSNVARLAYGNETVTGVMISGQDTRWYNANDTIAIYIANGTAGGAAITAGEAYSVWEVEKRQGSFQPSASDTVSIGYRTGAGQSIPNATTTVIEFGTKDWDTHGVASGSGTSWKLTAPTSGLYLLTVEAVLTPAAGWAAGEEFSLFALINGVFSTRIASNYTGASHSTYMSTNGSILVRLLANQYVQVAAYQSNGSAITMLTDSGVNAVTLVKVGNY